MLVDDNRLLQNASQHYRATATRLFRRSRSSSIPTAKEEFEQLVTCSRSQDPSKPLLSYLLSTLGVSPTFLGRANCVAAPLEMPHKFLKEANMGGDKGSGSRNDRRGTLNIGIVRTWQQGALFKHAANEMRVRTHTSESHADGRQYVVESFNRARVAVVLIQGIAYSLKVFVTTFARGTSLLVKGHMGGTPRVTPLR
jgi:hypothetical protein